MPLDSDNQLLYSDASHVKKADTVSSRTNFLFIDLRPHLLYCLPTSFAFISSFPDMATPSYGQATLLEKLDLLPAISQILGISILGAFTAPFRGSEGASTYVDHVQRTLLRAFFKRVTIAQLQ